MNVQTACGLDCRIDETKPPGVCPDGTTCVESAGAGTTPCLPPTPDAGGDTDAGGDADSTPDTPYDGPAYTSDDFSSFRWQFFGGTGGPAHLFEMDRDCGVDATENEFDGAVATTTCTLDVTDCDGFKSFVVSPTVLGALESTAPCVPYTTDDLERTSVTVTSGVVYDRGTDGCKNAEPFFTVQKELHRLEGLCAPDAGTD